MSYKRVNWEDFPKRSTPVNAHNLNLMDKGIEELDLNKVDKEVFEKYSSFTVHANMIGIHPGVKDNDFVNSALSSLEDNATVYFPEGVYYLNIKTEKRIHIVGSGNTVFKSLGSGALIEFRHGGSVRNIKGNGFNEAGVLRASYGLRIIGGGVYVENVTFDSFRFDCLYISGSNVKIVDSEFLQTTRNTGSIVSGDNIEILNSYFYNDKKLGGLYLFDIEPAGDNQVSNVFISGTTFDSEIVDGSSQVIVKSQGSKYGDNINVTFDSCNFVKNACIRPNNNSTKPIKGLNIIGCSFETRALNSPVISEMSGVIMNNNSDDYFLYNVMIKDSLFLNNNFKESDISRNLINTVTNPSFITTNNFEGVSGTQKYSESLFISSPTVRVAGPVTISENLSGSHESVKELKLSSSSYQNVLKLGRRSSYEITFAPMGGKKGVLGALHKQYVIVSEDQVLKSDLSTVIGYGGAQGLFVEYVDDREGSLTDDKVTMKLKAKSPDVTHWIVHVKSFGNRNTGDVIFY